jgi:hypothetical protein
MVYDPPPDYGPFERRNMKTAGMTPFHIFLLALACVFFFIGAFAWPAPVEPYRIKIVSAGLLAWCASSFF